MSKKLLYLFGSLILGCSAAWAQQVEQQPQAPATQPSLVAVPGTGGTITAQNVDSVDRAFTATLTGAEEVPPRETNASGAVAVTLNPDGESLHYRLSVADITDVVAAHLHIGLPGENGPIVVPLAGEGATPPPPGTASGVIAEGDITAGTLTGPLAGSSLAVLFELMRSGAIYANVHTARFPAGEIRGQVKGLGADPSAACELLQGAPAM